MKNLPIYLLVTSIAGNAFLDSFKHFQLFHLLCWGKKKRKKLLSKLLKLVEGGLGSEDLKWILLLSSFFLNTCPNSYSNSSFIRFLSWQNKNCY